MPNLPGSVDEFERAIEGGVQQVKSTVGKTASQTVSSTTKQLAPTDRDIVSSLYAPSGKEQPDQVDSGETSSPGEQILPSFGELSGSVSGSPKEPGQRPTLASVREQLNAPDEIIGALTGAPQGELLPTESPIEQLVPTATQVIGHVSGSVQATKDTPYTKSFGEQLAPPFEDIANSVVPSETTQGASEESQDIAQQANPQEMMTGDLDHSKQMSAQESATLNKEQKKEREMRWQFEREYRKFGTPLDDIGTLEEQVQKARQQREEEERKRKEEEEQEEEEKKKKEEEERQQLEEPTSKPAPGSPNIAIGQAQKKAEVHRGSSG